MNIDDWNSYFMNICQAVKLRSKDPKKQVGAVLVKNNRILSTGYNGLKSGVNDNIDWKDRELVHNLVLHAEMNCLLYNTEKNYDNEDNMVLYCTLSPCINCVKLIASSHINKIIYTDEYKDIETVKQICNFYNIQLIKHLNK